MSSPMKFDVNLISGLFSIARKLFDQLEARKRFEFSGDLPKSEPGLHNQFTHQIWGHCYQWFVGKCVEIVRTDRGHETGNSAEREKN